MTETIGHSYRSWVEVDLGAFCFNLSQINKHIGKDVGILQVVKADAYGHGALEIASAALDCGVAMLGVANADEGAQLRIGGIGAPILILSPSESSEIPEIVKHSLIPSVSTLAFARDLARYGSKTKQSLPLHIEVDTGMGRGGMMHSEALKVIGKIATLPNIKISGIFTHLAVSEAKDDEHNLEQRLCFDKLLQDLAAAGLHIPVRHIANSGAILNFPDWNFSLVRPGLMSYGVHPDISLQALLPLRPVMSFKTRVLLVKTFPAGCTVGYGKTFITKKRTKIATIPVGYADGLSRLLSNNGEALVRGRRCPIIGRISMDMCMLDVSALPGCASGEEVVLLGAQGKESILADEVASKAQSISYEVLCALGKRAPRVFIRSGKASGMEPRLRRIFIPEEEKSLERMNNIIRRCLQARVQNSEMGDAIYSEMLETLFGKNDAPLELRQRLRYRVALSEFGKKEIVQDKRLADFYKVDIAIEYWKLFTEWRFMIGCAQNNEQLKALFQEKHCEYRWLLAQPQGELTSRDFQLLRATVGGKRARIVEAHAGERGWEVWCETDIEPAKLRKPIRISFTISTRKIKESKMFSVFLVYPTRGAQIIFDYSRLRIAAPREVSFFAGKNPYPEVARQAGKHITLTISDKDWIFPNSGVTFIW